MSIQTLKKRADFLIANSGDKDVRRHMIVRLKKREDAEPTARVGLTVSKRNGNAVKRNRIKRRLRAAVSALRPSFLSGHDYIIIARHFALTGPFPEIESDLRGALKRLNKRALSQS